MASNRIAELVAAAAAELLNDPIRSKAAMTAAGLDITQRRTITEDTPVVRAAIFRILREPARRKAAMTKAGLTFKGGLRG